MRAVIVIALFAGCGFDVPATNVSAPDAGLDAPPDGPPVPFHLRIEAWIDGRSQLTFKGTTAQWKHFQFAAPGRELFVHKATVFDGVDWQPTWPDLPDAENRDCNCVSSINSSLPLAVPRAPSTTTLTAIQVRKPPSIIQEPTAANDYTLIVELTDVGVSGSSTDIVEVTVTPN